MKYVRMKENLNKYYKSYACIKLRNIPCLFTDTSTHI
jgi:hypothetical protein